MAEIPTGFCQCGCGARTKICLCGDKKRGLRRGEYFNFARGHNLPAINKKGESHPKWKGGKHSNGTGYIIVLDPEHPFAAKNGYVMEHILIAEKAMGKFLPDGAIVHHVNGKKGDNTRGNHVVCQDQAYHMLLEQRTRAFKACGHASWRKCTFCKKWDDPTKMRIPAKKGGQSYHRSCHSEYEAKRKIKNREATINDSQLNAPPC